MNSYDVMQMIDQRFRKLFDDLPTIIANEAVLFAKENFANEEWRGSTAEPWEKRKNENNTKKLLVDTGDLSRSIDDAEITATKDNATVIIGSNLPYAKAHNFGFEGKVEQSVKEHERRSNAGKTYLVKAHQRTLQMRIPKRQFIGNWKDSPIFQEKILRIINIERNKILSKP